MWKTSAKKRWLYFQGLTVLILLLPVGCYFFLYSPARKTYFANRDFRMLSLAGDQLKARIENSATAIQNLVKTYAAKDPDPAVRIKMAMTLIPNLTLDEEPLVSTNDPKGLKSTNGPIDLKSYHKWVTLEVEPAVSTSLLKFRYAVATNLPPPETGQRIISIKAKADFNNFVTIRPEFDGLLVAEQDGSVIFQRSMEGWRVLNVLNLADTKGGKLATNLLGQSSRLTRVNLAGTDYHLFLQPLQISSNIGGTNSQWWVCGAVRSGRFAAESLAIPHVYLVGFIFLVLLSVAVWPFAKLRLMGPRERLGKADVFVLVFATLGGSAVLVLLVLNVYTYLKAENLLDDRLEEFATNIKENLNAETARMYQQLTRFRDKAAVSANMTNYAGNPEWRFLTNVLAHTSIIDATNSAVDPYPYFEQVGWVKEGGSQTQKWTIKDFSTPFLSIKDRNYFRDAWDHRQSLYEFNSGGTNFWLESILSWNTGESSAIMSITDTNQVVYMESKLLSLLRPVVPPGFGYCVIANDGRVLFHSEVERNLQENLLLECDNAPALRVALMGGASGAPFDVHYHGKIHSFYIVPLAGFNWSLAVFRDEYLLDAADFDLVLISLYLLCFYLGLLVLIWLVMFRWIGEGLYWLWPQEGKSRSYSLAFRGSILIAVASLLAVAVIPDPLTVAVIGLAAAATSAGLFYLSLKFSWRLSKAPNPSRYPVRFVWALASFVLAVGAVPAFAFFKASYDSQIELFVKRGQLHFAKALQERAARVENDYDNPRMKIGPEDRERASFLDDRLQIASTFAAGDIKDFSAFATKLKNRSDPVSAFLNRQLSNTTFQALTAYPGPASNPESLQAALVPELNRIIKNPLYDPQRFAGSGLSPEMQKLLARNPGTRLNRLLLVHAYPRELSTQHMPLDLYTHCFFDTELELDAVEPVDPKRGHHGNDAKPDFFKTFLGNLRPFHYRTGGESQGLFRETAVDNSYDWEWDTDAAVLQTNRAGVETNIPGPRIKDQRKLVLHKDNFRKGQLLHVRSILPALLQFRAFPIGSTLLVIIGVAVCVGIFYLARLVARQVFLLDFMPEPSAELLSKHTLVLSSPRLPTQTTATPFINWNCNDEEVPARIDKLNAELAKDDHPKTITFFHFDRSFQNVEVNQKKVDLLERLVLEGRHNIRVYSAVDPSHFRVLEPPPKPDETTATSTLVKDPASRSNRLENLFRFFVREHQVRKKYSAAQEPQNTQGSSQSVEKGLLPEHPAYYRSLWLTFSKAEQLVLYQLSEEGFINAKNPELPGLLASGVIVRNPELKLADEGFKKFVLMAIRPEELKSHEQAEPDSLWKQFKVPFQTVLIVLALLLFLTQQELFSFAVQLMGVFAGAVAGLSNFFNLFQKSPAQR